MKNFGRVSRALGALLAISLLSGCTAATSDSADVAAPVRHRESVIALDTVIDLTVYGDRWETGQDAAKETILHYEALLSVTDEDSDICRINNAGGAPTKVDAHTASLVFYARELSELTGGGFDITIYPVVRAWGFTSPEFRIPASDELEKLLEFVDYRQIFADNVELTVTVPPGVMLDLGGVAKGYIGDRAIDALREAGVASAIINLGGNVQTLGVKPDGSDWTVSVRDPNSPSGTFCTVTLGEGAVVTSGGYQRYFTAPDGAVYHHIIDPATGYPAESGIASVTVVSTGSWCGFYGDGLTTALFVGGTEKSLGLWRNLGGRVGDNMAFELIIVTDGGEVVITPGLKNRVTLTSDAYRLTVAEETP